LRPNASRITAKTTSYHSTTRPWRKDHFRSERGRWLPAAPTTSAAAAAARPPLSRSPRDLTALVLVGLADVGANVMFAAASTLGLVSIVGVLSSLYPVVTIFLARAFLHERIDRVQEIGVVGALAGVALIAAG
jgi:drug/metabolite transporter (DMT)-like permease